MVRNYPFEIQEWEKCACIHFVELVHTSPILLFDFCRYLGYVDFKLCMRSFLWDSLVGEHRYTVYDT